MEVLLKEAVAKLGVRGQVVKVSPGFARNFLFPKRLAMPVTLGNKRQLAVERRNYDRRVLNARTSADEAKNKIEALELVVTKRAADNGQLFGSVTHAEVSTILAGKGFDVDRRKLVFAHINQLGEYAATVKLHHEVTATFKIKVVPAE